MVVGLRAAEVVDHGEVLREVVGDAVRELHLVDGAVRAALAAGAVVRDDDDERVLELAVLLQVVEQAPDVVVGVGEETRVHLGHPGEEPLLLVVQRIPRAGDVEQRERLPLGPVRVSGVPIGLIGGSSVSAGTMPSSFWLASVCSRIAS